MVPNQVAPDSPLAGDVLESDTPDLESTAERTIVDLTGADPLVSVGRYRYLEAHEPLPTQRHSSLLVVVLPIRGHFDFVLDGKTVPVGPGMALVIKPGVAYRTGLGAQSRGELLWLVARTTLPGADGFSVGLAIQLLCDSGRLVWETPGAGRDLLLRALGQADGDTDDFVARWRGQMCAAAVFELARDLRQAGFAHAPIHPGVRLAQRWIDDHLSEPISAAELVQVSGMSATHFYLQFAQGLGTSPKDYVMRRKIAHAQVLLHEPDRTVTDIAHALGFATSQHFGTAFRRYVGTTPSGYRNSHQALSPGVS